MAFFQLPERLFVSFFCFLGFFSPPFKVFLKFLFFLPFFGCLIRAGFAYAGDAENNEKDESYGCVSFSVHGGVY